MTWQNVLHTIDVIPDHPIIEAAAIATITWVWTRLARRHA